TLGSIANPEDSVSRRLVPGRPRATNTCRRPFSALFRHEGEEPLLGCSSLQTTFKHQEEANLRYYGAKSFTMQGLYARRPVVCVPLNGRQRRNRLCWAREHVSDAATMGFCAAHRRRWWNPGLGRDLACGHTDLHVFHGGTVTGLRYRDEILDPYVRPYAAANGNDFILMDDNARPHRARIVEEYLEDHGLERMEWPARSQDLNPIEHLFGTILAESLLLLNPPPRSLHELKQGLLCVWSSLLFRCPTT
ncbi:transposable element Tcb2 transposase, partial [Trichonephila clavipes]